VATLTLYVLPVLLLLAATYIILAKVRGSSFAYLCLFWIPPISFLLMYVFQQSLERALSYGVIVLLLLSVTLSLVLGMNGIVLVLRAHNRGETHIGLIAATLLASLPAIIFAVDLARRR